MIEIIPNWHPIFVHFTVALLSIAVLLSVLVRFMPASKLREQWQLVAQWNLWLGAGITVFTVVAGVLAYNSVVHDTPSHEAMTDHRNWALVTAALFIGLAIWSWLRVRANKTQGTLLLVGLLLGGVLLASTAWRGGEAVYRFGLGVMSLPKVDSHDHASADHGPAGGSDSHAGEKMDAGQHPHDDQGGVAHTEHGGHSATEGVSSHSGHESIDDGGHAHAESQSAQAKKMDGSKSTGAHPHDDGHMDDHAH